MTKNVGKKFEDMWRNSVPDHCLLIRLSDPPQAFSQSKITRFSNKNPCDFLMFDGCSKILFCLELKTTSSKSISFEDIDDENSIERMVHKHQIIGLTEYSKYDGVIAGIVSNFRDSKNDVQRTYFQNIKDFNNMRKKIAKFSYNELDLIVNGAIKIDGKKKRVNYTWDIDKFINDVSGVKDMEGVI